MKPRSLNYGKCRHTSGSGEERVEEGGVGVPGEQEEGPNNECENQKRDKLGVWSMGRKMGWNYENK